MLCVYYVPASGTIRLLIVMRRRPPSVVMRTHGEYIGIIMYTKYTYKYTYVEINWVVRISNCKLHRHSIDFIPPKPCPYL